MGLADTLGSVGVIVSSLLIHYFGWTWTDAVCSIFISLLIFVTVIPLVTETGYILLQRTPPELASWSKRSGVPALLQIKGVLGIRDIKLWAFDSVQIVGEIYLLVTDTADQDYVLRQAKSIYGQRVQNSLTVTLE